MKVSWSIIEDSEKQQLIWYRLVRRMGEKRSPKKILQRIPPERKQGKPPTT